MLFCVLVVCMCNDACVCYRCAVCIYDACVCALNMLVRVYIDVLCCVCMCVVVVSV